MKKLTSVVLSILMVISMLSCLFVGSVSAEEANNSVTAAEIYDISGKKIDNEQTYTNVTTAVNGEEVTATVEYDKDSGAYFFLGWYDETGAKVSADEAYTFTPAEGKIYTPRIGSANLLGGSGSFENYENGENLAVDISTLKTAITSVDKVTADNIPNYSGNNKWATNENAGYLGATWPETIYDKDGNNYQQVATYRTIRLLNTFNVVEDATIAKSGSKYLHINGGGASSLGLENLNKNTDYKLSFYLRYSGVNANKIKSVGVTTTVNINNDQYNKDATLNSQGMLITLENAVPSHKITVAKCDSTELSKVSTTEWQKITVDFNSGNLEKLYLAIVSTNGAALNYYIDDMVLVKAGDANSVSAANVEFHDANGGAVDSSNEYAKADIIGNFDGTYTAKVAYDKDNGAYAFKGWYYDGELANVGELFDINAETYPDVSLFKAVITSANLLPEAASFESYKSQTTLTYADSEKVDGVFPAPTSTKWGTSYNSTYFSDNYFKIHTVYGAHSVSCYNAEDPAEKETDRYTLTKTVTPISGSSMLRINTQSRNAIRALENLTPNTDYLLTFYVLGTSVKDYVSAVGVADRYDGYNVNEATDSTEGTVTVKKLTYSENWQKVTLSFNSGDKDTLYLHIHQTSLTANGTQGGSYLDGLSLIALPSAEVAFENADGSDYKGANEAAAATIVTSTEKSGYLVAKIDYLKDSIYSFGGWYDGETLVSKEESFEFVNGEYQKLTAKVVLNDNNVSSATGSFEDFDLGTSLVYTGTDYPSGAYFGGNKNAGYLGQTREETIYDNEGNEIAQQASGSETPSSNGVSAVVTDEKAHTGKKSVLVQNNFWTTALGIDVKPNTDYSLSYYILAPEFVTGEVNTVESTAIATSVNTGNGGVAPANLPLNQASALYLDKQALTTVHDGENWIKVTHTFNSMNLDKVYLVICQTSIGGKPSSSAYIDDIICVEADHIFEEYVSNGDATCTEDGTKTAKCTIHGCTATDTIKDEGTAGHIFTNYVSNGDATCTEDGTKTATCDRDGCDATDTIKDEGTAGHIFTNYVSDGNATCTEDGTKTAVCDRDGCDATDTITDEGTAGHIFTNYVSDGNATCTEDGTKTAVCDRDGCDATDTITDEGSKLGHSFTKYVSDKNATCTADGTKTAVCDRDGCNVTNTVKDVGSKLPHKYTNACDTTCNDCGATRTVGAHKYSNNCDTTCNICGAVRKITHSYKTYTTKATLTKNGSIVKKCSVCGVTASTTVIYYPKTVKIAATTYTYNGKVITPAVTVKNSKGTALKKGTDYTVTYASGRKNVGKYKVTVTFKGNYSGTKTFYFTINPVKTTVRKLTAGKKSIKVNITKKSTQVTGYQIQYSTSKTFKSAKTKTISSYKTTSTTLTKLTSKKTYYVRVRTYKTVGKTKYYSAWSTYKYTKAK